MKQFVKRIFGITKLEEEKAELQTARDKAIAETYLAKQQEEYAKLTPKERATAKGEPWVAVLDTHVNKDNIRNGFFELDWNEIFVLELKRAGYGFDGDPDEEIVDRWFRDLARNMLGEAGVSDPGRVNAGYINVSKLPNGRAQIE